MEPEGTYPNKLRWFLKQSGITQEELANATGIGRSMLSLYINGRIPTPNTTENNARERIAKYFDVPIKTIFPAVLPPSQEHSGMDVRPVIQQPLQMESQSASNAHHLGIFLHKFHFIRELIQLYCGRAAYVDELFLLICQELQTMEQIANLSPTGGISRRHFLASLGAIGIAPQLVVSILEKPSTTAIETFLPECTASMAACRNLMRGYDFKLVSPILDSFFPALEALAKNPSRYQAAALKLTAHGHRYYAMISGHQLNYQGRIDHYKQSALYANELPEKDIYALALTRLGRTYTQMLRDPEQAMIHYQQALQYVDQISPLMQSDLYADIAFAQAQMGKEYEFKEAIEKARSVYPSSIIDTEKGLSTGSMYQLEAWSYVELFSFRGDVKLLEQALACYDLKRETPVSKRGLVEIVNNQATAALKLGDLDQFEVYFLEGAKSAKTLGSPIRQKEVEANWNGALEKWANEPKLQEWKEQLLQAHP